MNKQETFDFASVSSKMKELEELFNQFSIILENTDEVIHDAIHSSSSSSLVGESADTLLKVWEDNTINFPEFKRNFAKWSELVSKISLNNKEVDQSNGSTLSSKMSIQETKEGGHIVTTVNGTETTTKFYDAGNNPVKVVVEMLDDQNQCVRTTKTDTMIVTDILNADGYSVRSSVTRTNGDVYKIVHENGYKEYLNQTGATVDLNTYDTSFMQDKENSFLREEIKFKQ